jgi:hypothetical protein
VQLLDIAAAGAIVKAIHILRHEREAAVRSPFEFRQSKMPRIGLRPVDDLTPPVVPFPNQPRIAGKGLGGGKLLRGKISPQAARPAKRRNTALGGDAGPRKGYDSRSLQRLAQGP